jgi:hypothetical protein
MGMSFVIWMLLSLSCSFCWYLLMNGLTLMNILQVYLGEQYVNSSTLSDVIFLVEGRRFFAHRIALLASSDAFRAMFDGGYRVGLHFILLSKQSN